MELLEQSCHLELGEKQRWLEMLWKATQISRVPPLWVSSSDMVKYQALGRVY